MAKTFGDLKKGDIIYSLSVYQHSEVLKTGNCEEAYKTLGLTFYLENYPAISENLCIYEVIEIEPSVYFEDKIILSNKNNPAYGSINISPVKSNKIFTRQFFAGSHYEIFAVDVDSLKEKAEELIHAMEAVNRNTMVVKLKKYKEMLEKLKSL